MDPTAQTADIELQGERATTDCVQVRNAATHIGTGSCGHGEGLEKDPVARGNQRMAAISLPRAASPTLSWIQRRACPPPKPVWLLVEWPEGEEEPTRYFLCDLPQTYTLRRLVRLAKCRWKIEQDYQQLKEELGLDHYEGRSWRGWHHHVTLTMLAHAFLTLGEPAEQKKLLGGPCRERVVRYSICCSRGAAFAPIAVRNRRGHAALEYLT